MIIIKIRGDSGEIRGKMLKPYVLDGVPTFGLNRGERFALVLQNTTNDVVTVQIFDAEREIRLSGILSGLSSAVIAEGFSYQTRCWVIEPHQEITALRNWQFKGNPLKISVAWTHGNGRSGNFVEAKIWPWRRLIEHLREEWARGKLAGGLRASWQLFSRFED